ncbi:hypothetical protein L0F63_005205, partial [Massospora cicadina]
MVMGRQEIIQVLLVDGTVVVVFLDEGATASDLVRTVVDDISVGRGTDLGSEYSDWVAILLPPDAQVGFQEVLEASGEVCETLAGYKKARILGSGEKIFRVVGEALKSNSQEVSNKETITDVHDLSQNLHRAYFKVLNVRHQLEVVLKDIEGYADGTPKTFYISPSLTCKGAVELLIMGLNLPTEVEGRRGQSEPPYRLTMVKINAMQLETSEPLQDLELILPIYSEYQNRVASGEIQRFEVRFSSQANWFSKMGTMTSRLTQNLSRPLSVFAFFGEGAPKAPASALTRRETDIKTRIASPTRKLRHISLTGKDLESGVDFTNVATWDLGDSGSDRRQTILDPSFNEDWAATYPTSRGSKQREKLDPPDDVTEGTLDSPSSQLSYSEELDKAFNRVLDELNIKAGVRAKMLEFPPSKKMELIEQNDAVQRMKGSNTPTPATSRKSTPFTRPNSITSAPLDLAPPPEGPGSAAQASLETLLNSGRSPPKGGGGITGFLFGNLFSGAANHPEGSVEFYLARLNSNTAPQEMFKCLQSLRITLSSAAVPWIRSFLEDGTALAGMATLLERQIAKNLSLADAASSARAQDLEEDVHLECVRCLRALLNTEPGFHEVLQHPSIIQCIAFSINTSRDKLRNIVAEVLAATCVLSKAGHHSVLEAFSDFRLKFHEDYRFQYLLHSLHEPVSMEGIAAIAAHDFKTTCLSLINAIVNTPESLDGRMLLREEFRRRGLGEIFTDLRESYPQESLIKQMECYEEETEADLHEMRERILIGVLESNQLDPLLGLAETLRALHPESVLRSIAKEIVTLTNHLLSAEVDDEVRYEILNLSGKFLQHGSRFVASEDWAVTFLEFFADIRESVGLSLREILESDAQFKAELHRHRSLEATHLELQERVRRSNPANPSLKLKASQDQLAKITAMPTISYLLDLGKDEKLDLLKGPKDNFTTLVQRLAQKEKEIATLHAKLDAAKLRGPGPHPAPAKAQASTWSAIKQELDIQKQANKELRAAVDARGKEIAYLKRSLEAVCTRFQLTVNELVPDSLELNPPSNVEPTDLISIPELQVLQAELDASRKELAAKERLESENKALNDTNLELRRQLEARPLRRTPSPHDPSEPKGTRPTPTLTFKELGSAINASNSRPELESPPLTSASETKFGSGPLPSPSPRPPVTGQGATPSTLVETQATKFVNGQPFGADAPSANEPIKPKSLFWKKIPTSKIPNTLWEHPAEEDILKDLDWEELEALFCKKVSKKPGSGYTSIGRRIRGKKSITLIDLNRANNIAIALARMKMPFSAIKLAILEVDDARLSMDNLRSLESNAPTQEEIKLVRSHTDLLDNLGTAEKYILQIMDIPRLPERLNCMIFRRRFDADVEELLPELEVLSKVTGELRSSKRLKGLLEITLALGNYLNADTPRGDARGFKFDGLNLLKDVKANGRKEGIPLATLLHYLAQALEEKRRAILEVREEFPSMEAAARVSVTTLTNNIYSLSQGVKQVQHELRAHRKLIALPENDRFIPTMEQFVARASRVAAEVKAKGERLEREIEDLLTYFGEDAATKPEDFLNLVIGFLDALENARAENAKLKAKAQRASTQVPDPGIRIPASVPVRVATKLPGFGQGDFDVAVRELRSGLRRRRTERPRGPTPTSRPSPDIPLKARLCRTRPMVPWIVTSFEVQVPRYEFDPGVESDGSRGWGSVSSGEADAILNLKDAIISHKAHYRSLSPRQVGYFKRAARLGRFEWVDR